MEKVYKGAFGWKPEDENHPNTHRLLTEEEYQQLRQEIADAKEEARRAWQAVEDMKISAQRYKATVDKAAQKRVEAAQELQTAAEMEMIRQIDLNANLRRLACERANADRKVQNKKQHDGYIVFSSQEYQHTYKPGRNAEKLWCWKTVVQSPYSATIPLNTVKPDIKDDLINKFGARLGFERVVQGVPEDRSKNTVFLESYRANFKAGYWEIEYLHTHPVTVPEDMR